MRLPNATALTLLGVRLKDASRDGDSVTIPLKPNELEAILSAIEGIGIEIKKAHLYSTLTEFSVRDRFFAHALSSGKSALEAIQVVKDLMEIRTQLVTLQATAQSELDDLEDEEEGEEDEEEEPLTEEEEEELERLEAEEEKPGEASETQSEG